MDVKLQEASQLLYALHIANFVSFSYSLTLQTFVDSAAFQGGERHDVFVLAFVLWSQ
jgi:hypothetical protein